MIYNCRRGFSRVLILLICVIAVAHALPKTHPHSAASQGTAATRRPLRMLVLGDSVMWGQGLRDDNKFSYRLRDWLCKERGGGSCPNPEDVQLHVEAHSGAVISQVRAKEKEEERFTRNVAPLRFYGEVNNSLPTVWGQIDLAQRYYGKNSIPLGEVDLVIINGGINDLNASTLLVHKLIGGDVTKGVEKHFAPMPDLLKKVADTFPSARIVVPGYFPLVSEKTSETILSDTIKDWLFGLKKEKEVVEEAIKEEKRFRAAERLEETRPGRILRMFAKRSLEFVNTSNRVLAGAVEGINKNYAPLPALSVGSEPIPKEATMRALFVPVEFKPENTYAAENSYLWQLGRRPPDIVLKCADENLLSRLVVNDEMQPDRPCMCDHAGRTNNLTCVRAGAFHPNTKGANKYFEEIKKTLENITAFAGWTTKV